MYKIRLERYFFETCNKWLKWWGLSVDIKILAPGGCLLLVQGYIHVLNHGKKCIKSDFKDFFFKLAQMNEVTRHFCRHQNFVPWGLSAPAPGLYTCIKSWKQLYKIRLQRDYFFKLATNDLSDKMFLLTSKFRPQGAVSPCPGSIYMYKIMKKMHKIRLQRDFFETCNKWPKWQDVLLTSTFRPQGFVSPCPGSIYVYKIMKKMHKIRLQRAFLKLVANYRSDKRFWLTLKFCPLGCLPLNCGYIHLLNHEKMCIKSEVEEILFKLATNDHIDDAVLLT